MGRSGNVSRNIQEKDEKKLHRINSTPQVIRACICRIRSILQVTQRVPPTCTTKTTLPPSATRSWPETEPKTLFPPRQWTHLESG